MHKTQNTFDVPHAKNEVVGGKFTEYCGRLLALFLLAIDIEMIVLSALINAIFLGGVFNLNGVIGFIIFLIKTFLICLIFVIFRVAMARVRVDQVVKFSWKWLVPLSIIQILIDITIK